MRRLHKALIGIGIVGFALIMAGIVIFFVIYPIGCEEAIRSWCRGEDCEERIKWSCNYMELFNPDNPYVTPRNNP